MNAHTIKVVGRPFQRGKVLFFNCKDNVERTCDEIGAHYGVTGSCFYQRWRRYDEERRRRGTADISRLYAVGNMKPGVRRSNETPTSEWLAMTRPAVNAAELPENTRLDDEMIPSRPVKNEEASCNEILASYNHHNERVGGTPAPTVRCNL